MSSAASWRRSSWMRSSTASASTSPRCATTPSTCAATTASWRTEQAPMSTVRVLGLGDNIVDRFVDRGVEYPGGNAVNVAVFARQLGAEAAYLGVFGDDEQGRFVRQAIEDC